MKRLTCALAALALVGCGEHRPDPSGQLFHASGPDWVSQGSGAFSAGSERIFRGVGIASGLHDATMRRSTAEARARAELTNVLDAYAARLEHDCRGSLKGASHKADAQLVRRAVEAVARKALAESPVVDRWLDTDGTEYALARLDMDALKQDLAQAQELSPQARQAVRANADPAFDDLGAKERQRAAR
ncbi:MAG: hypothetical protein NVS2B9_09290 [Myxococcales bacterium]